jgi:hypothetical protein
MTTTTSAAARKAHATRRSKQRLLEHQIAGHRAFNTKLKECVGHLWDENGALRSALAAVVAAYDRPGTGPSVVLSDAVEPARALLLRGRA